MPCTDGGYTDREYEQRRISETEKKLDKVTHMLCKVLARLEEERMLVDITHALGDDGETIEWWEDHKEKDRQRLIKETEERNRKVKQIKDRIKSTLNGIDLTPSEIEELINQLKNKK